MANFSKMLGDPILAQSLKVTIVFSAISVPLGLVFAFFLANLINAKVPLHRHISHHLLLAQHRAGGGQRHSLGLAVQHRIRPDQLCDPRLRRS